MVSSAPKVRWASSARRAGLALAALLVLVVSPTLAVAQSQAPNSPERLIAVKTGAVGRELPAGGVRHEKTGYLMQPARSGGRLLRTWVQQVGEGVRFVAALDPGQSQALYPDFVPEDMTMRLLEDGTIEVSDPSGRVAGLIAAPWAVDATGRSLPTRYVISGRAVIQLIDVKDARYPIVADPWVTTGWWYTTPVYYVELSRAETLSLRSAVNSDASSAPALLCGYIPSTTGRIVCGATYILMKADVKSTVNEAVAVGKCYKVRLPASAGAVALPAYDSYYKTCIR